MLRKAPFFSYVVRMVTFFGFLGLSLYMNARNIQIKDIPHLDKLSTNVINTIFQDSEGYIWYGTAEGLCRDDGYNIHTFRSDFKDPDMMPSNVITCLGEDSITHNIWIGTDKGLYILNKQTYTIASADIAELKDINIEGIIVTSDHSIWINVYRRMFRLSPEGEIQKMYPLQCSTGPGEEYVLYEDRKHQLLLSISGKGLHKWNKQKDEFELFFPYTDRISDLIQDREKDYYWLASWQQGIIRLDPLNSVKELQYVPQPLPMNSAGQIAKTALHLVQDDVNNYIWTISWSDLFAYQVTTGGLLKQVDTSTFLPQYNKALKRIIKDRDGNLWVTSLDNHNFIIYFDEDNLHEYNIAPLEKQIKWTPIFENLCKDEKGIFWVFQRRLGLCIYQPEKDKIECYTSSKAVSDSPFLVLSYLLKSKKQGLVWVVPQSSCELYGLSQNNMEIEIERRVNLFSVSKTYDVINYLFEDNDGNLWIAAGNHLFIYQIESEKLELVSDNIGVIKGLAQTEDGIIWGIVKNKGIIRIDRERHMTEYSAPHSFLCVAADHNKLWLGTDKGGIMLFDSETGSFEDYNTACGVNGDKISNIIVDRFHHVWITTSREVKEFNPKNGAYRSFYASSKNIGFNRFLPQSVFEDADGQLYFGGIPGILSISPSQRLDNISQPKDILITDIRIMGRSILLDNKRPGKSLKVVDIYPEEQNIEIQFSSLDYQNSSRIRYAYRLSGIDKEWIYLSAGKNSAFYNKLSKGKYVFQVKATDGNGLWSDHVVEISLNRLPAWYESWYAYTVYVLCILAITYYFYRMVRNRIRMRQAIAMGKIERQKIEEINHAKLQFFTNITHELLTPLSIISASVDELKEEIPSSSRLLQVMENNTSRLIRLIQQILEFRKVENGKLKLKVSCGNISLFLKNSVLAFAPLVKKKKLSISLEATEECSGYFDVDKLDKIIYNLLSNAAKYTPEGGAITLCQSYDEETGLLKITVNNPGECIPEEKLAHLFERFYEGEYRKFHTIGTGIGLSLTKDLVALHHGTIYAFSNKEEGNTFVVQIPVRREAFKEEEIDESMEYAAYNVLPVGEVEEAVATDMAEREPGSSSVLLVEDNEDLLSSMVRLLQGRYHILQARNGVEALAVLEKEEVNLIVSDIMMPEMDGIELCRRIKEKFETCHIPVILLTAKITDEDQVMGYESGADGYICKPLRLSVLLAKIDNLLKKSNRMGIDFRKQLVFEAKELNFTSMDEAFIQKAVDCVNAHLDDCNFEHAQFLAEMGMARTTLADKLKLLTGLTPSGFINNVRLQAACRLIDEKKKIRISDLAYAVGFNDPKYFSLCFRKKFGLSPTEYMMKYEN